MHLKPIRCQLSCRWLFILNLSYLCSSSLLSLQKDTCTHSLTDRINKSSKPFLFQLKINFEKHKILQSFLNLSDNWRSLELEHSLAQELIINHTRQVSLLAWIQPLYWLYIDLHLAVVAFEQDSSLFNAGSYSRGDGGNYYFYPLGSSWRPPLIDPPPPPTTHAVQFLGGVRISYQVTQPRSAGMGYACTIPSLKLSVRNARNVRKWRIYCAMIQLPFKFHTSLTLNSLRNAQEDTITRTTFVCFCNLSSVSRQFYISYSGSWWECEGKSAVSEKSSLNCSDNKGRKEERKEDWVATTIRRGGVGSDCSLILFHHVLRYWGTK